METSAWVGKPEWQLMNFWKLNADNFKLNTPGDPVIKLPSQYCEVHLQELNNIPIVNIG